MLIRISVARLWQAALATWLTAGFVILITLKGPGFQPWAASEFIILGSLYFIILLATQSKRRMSGVGLITFVLTLYMLLHAMLAADIERGLASVFLHLKYIWFFLAMAHALQISTLDYMMRIWLLIAAVAILVGLIIAAGVVDTGSLYGLGGYDRQSGVFPNPNMYGSFVSTAILIAIAYTGPRRTFAVKVLFGMFFLGAAIALFLTFSRRAWVLGASAAVLMLILSKKKGNFVNIMGLGIVLLAPIFLNPEVFFMRVSQIFDSQYEANTARFDQLYLVMDLLRGISFGYLFGAGAGQIGPAATYGKAASSSAVDPYYLVVLGEYGLVGVFLIGCLYLSVAVCGAKLFLTARLDSERRKIAALTLAFLLLCVIGLVGLTPVTFPLSIIQWTIAAYILILSAKERKRVAPRSLKASSQGRSICSIS